MMRLLIILSAICFSTNAMAQASPPKVGNNRFGPAPLPAQASSATTSDPKQ